MSAPPGQAAGTRLREPASYEEAAEMVREAEAAGQRLVPAGLGNHLRLDYDQAAPLSLKRLSRVLRYEPEDFTIGVQAGMPLDALRAVLGENGQEVPVDIAPSPRGTVGGALAQNRFGARRGRYGTFRTYTIGVAGLRGGGRIYHAGGMVVKNVAGYDVMKLLIGSRGAFGPILEVNLKLRPIPAARSARRASFCAPGEAWKLARGIRARALEPAALAVLSPQAAADLDLALGARRPAAWTVLWSFEGNAGAVRWLDGEAERLLAEAKPEEASVLDPAAYGGALEFLAAAREVEPAEAEETILLSLAFPPSDGPAAQEALHEMLLVTPLAQDARARSTLADAASGIHLARLRPGPAAAGAAAQHGAKLLDQAREVLRRFRGAGRILSAPRWIAAPEDGLLSPDPAADVADRVRRAFDPHGVFGAPPGEGRMP